MSGEGGDRTRKGPPLGPRPISSRVPSPAVGWPLQGAIAAERRIAKGYGAEGEGIEPSRAVRPRPISSRVPSPTVGWTLHSCHNLIKYLRTSCARAREYRHCARSNCCERMCGGRGSRTPKGARPRPTSNRVQSPDLLGPPGGGEDGARIRLGSAGPGLRSRGGCRGTASPRRREVAEGEGIEPSRAQGLP